MDIIERAANHPDYKDAVAVLERLARVGSPKQQSSGMPAPDDGDGAAWADAAAKLRALRPEELVHSWPESTLRDLLEGLPDAVVVISGSGAIVLVNGQTERVFGYKREEMLGRPIE